jgi:hypothetical protein
VCARTADRTESDRSWPEWETPRAPRSRSIRVREDPDAGAGGVRDPRSGPCCVRSCFVSEQKVASRLLGALPAGMYRFASTPLQRLPFPGGRRRSGMRADGRLNRRKGLGATWSPASAVRAGSCSHAARTACSRRSTPADDTQLQGFPAEGHGRPRRRTPACPSPRSCPWSRTSIIEHTGVDPDCVAGEAARMAQGRHDPPSPGRTDPPAQLPPQP